MRILDLRFFASDIQGVYKAMYWEASKSDCRQLSAELLFQYHKLEKGLSMPSPRRFFGADPAKATMRLLDLWRTKGFSTVDPVYIGAIESLVAYRARLISEGYPQGKNIVPVLDQALSAHSARSGDLTTPRRYADILQISKRTSGSFEGLAMQRRSVRDFSDRAVPLSTIERAVELAMLSPSACNRQPCKVYVASEQERKARLLRYQNGNRGFGHTAAHVLVVTADQACFFGATERHEPYVDGGLFAMSLILGLQDQGVSSCCLNWCVTPSVCNAVHSEFGITQTERIIMLIAVGYASKGCLVPRSPRRELSEVLRKI